MLISSPRCGPEHAEPLAALLLPHYYVDVEMIQNAVRRYSSFNVIHLATMFKVDVFVPQDTPFARENMAPAHGP